MKRTTKAADALYFKFFIYLLGISFVAGSIFLSYMVYQRSANIIFSEAAGEESCIGGAMTLQTDGEIEFSMQDGNRVFLLSKTGQANQELIVIDYCTNKVISRINFNNTEPVVEMKNEVQEHVEDDNDVIMIDGDKLSKAG